MPSRPRKDMTTPKEWTIAHRSVVTDERTSGGWIGCMTTKRIPDSMADRPAHRMRFAAVVFIVRSFGEALAPGQDGFRHPRPSPGTYRRNMPVTEGAGT